MNPRKAGATLAWSLAFAVTLAVSSGWASESEPLTVTLSWTTPGDDGWTGRAALFDLRYSNEPITERTFPRSIRLAVTPPRPAGAPQTFVVSGLDPSREHYFAIKTMDESGNWSALSNVARVTPRVETTADLPKALQFSVPWPNPARASTRFQLDLPRPQNATIEVFDGTGRRVRVLSAGELAAGSAEIVWDLADERGHRVPPGLYLVRALAGREAFVRRLAVIP